MEIIWRDDGRKTQNRIAWVIQPKKVSKNANSTDNFKF